MSAPEVLLRTAAYAFLRVKLLASAFSYNDFTIRESWLPRDEKSDNTMKNGVLSVITTLANQRRITRGDASTAPAIEMECRLQLVFQKNLKEPKSIEEADLLTVVIDEIREMLRSEFSYDNWTWLNFLPYNEHDNLEIGVNPLSMREGSYEVTLVSTYKKGST